MICITAPGAHVRTHTKVQTKSGATRLRNKLETSGSKSRERCYRFAGLMMGFQSGMPPAPDQVRKVAEEMDGINEQWRVLLTRQGGRYLGFRV
jgi:hypothetical protein